MPAGIDPFDLYRESGGGAVRAALEEAVPFVEWLLAELDPDEAPEERSRKLNVIVEILQSIPDRALRYEYVRKVAAAAGMPADVLWTGRPARPGTDSGVPPDEQTSRKGGSCGRS
jgi:DNA primase